MKDEEKTKEQLLTELESLRKELADLNLNTAHKWVEAALRESEERYRRLFESITDYMYTVKIENGQPVSTTYGPGCLAVTGYTSDYLQIHPNLWYEMIYEADREAVCEQVEKSLKGEAVQSFEHRIIHKDGSIRWIRNILVQHYDKDGHLISYDGLISDITEKKTAEEQLKAIFDNSSDGILLVDTESKRFYIGNKRILEMLGYSIDEIKTLGVMDIHPEKDLPYVIDQFERQARKEFTIAKDIPVKRKDGIVFYADINSSPMHIGKKRYLLGIFRDITERRKTEEGLRASREYARNIIESSMDMIIVVDKDRKITEFNKAAQETFGYALEEVSGKDVDMLYAAPSEGLNVHDVTLEKGRHLQEVVNRRKNGELFPSMLSSSILRNAKGDIVGLMGVSHDITRRKRDVEALNESFGNLEKAKKEWEATFDSISDPLFIHDREMRLVRVNRTYLTASGEAKFKNIIGRPYYEVFPKMDGPFKMCLKALELQEEEEEFYYINKVFKVRFFPINDVSGGHLYSIHILEDITEAKRMQEKIKEEMEITSHLLMISEAMAGMTDIDKLMKQVAHCSREVLGCDICLAYLWNNDERLFMPVHAIGLPQHLVPSFMTEPIKEKYFLNGISQALKDLFSWSREVTIGNVISVPLTARNEYLGLIIGIFSNEVELADRHMKVINGISRQVGVALEEAKLYRESVDKTMELSHRIETIHAMHEIDKSILSTLEPQEILETAVRQVGKVASCDRVTVVLVNKESEAFTFAAGFGLDVISKGTTIGLEDTNLSDVLRTGRTIYIPNLMEIGELRAFEKRIARDGLVSQLRIPLTVKGEIVGILTVGSRRPAAFTPQDLSTLEKIASQIGVALQNARQLKELEELFVGTVKSLSSAIDAKSPWTAGHSERVTKYALDIAKEMGLAKEDMKVLELAGLLHDIGKIGTYDFLLDKPGKLEPDEIEIVRLHPVKGAAILEPIKKFRDIIPAIRHHHEYFNGNGYPDKLKGADIPFFARILSVADTYDAMKADRPYRPGRSMAYILEEFKKCSGTQFDPMVVEAFLRIEGKLEQ